MTTATRFVGRPFLPSLVLPVLLLAFGCRSLGARTIARDRLAYSLALSESAKKRTISFVMFLFTLAGSGTESSLPVLTIPAGG